MWNTLAIALTGATTWAAVAYGVSLYVLPKLNLVLGALK